jgi:ribonuclease D
VAQKLVASSADLERLATDGDRADVPALHGWRRDIFGGDALRLREGRLALALKDGRLAVREVPAD